MRTTYRNPNTNPDDWQDLQPMRAFALLAFRFARSPPRRKLRDDKHLGLYTSTLPPINFTRCLDQIMEASATESSAAAAAAARRRQQRRVPNEKRKRAANASVFFAWQSTL
jgi:hypothetical protein